jgi:rubrerythrin
MRVETGPISYLSFGGFDMSKTEANLKEAFAGESQAFQKYTAFAKKAEQDGFKNVARLFKTTAQAELIHASGHLGALDGIKSTAENLQAAIEGETYEFTEMYPPMTQTAEEESHKAKRMFSFAKSAEAVHAALYKQALEAVQQGRDLSEENIYLCPVCGHIELGNPPEICPICGTKKDKFIQV